MRRLWREAGELMFRQCRFTANGPASVLAGCRLNNIGPRGGVGFSERRRQIGSLQMFRALRA
jgi:hypothetical protein